MNAIAHRSPFTGRRHDPEEHFRLLFWGGVLHLRRLLDPADRARLPFLDGYLGELAGTDLAELDGAEAARRWEESLAAWEAGSPVRLPLADLRGAAGVSRFAMLLWAALGVVQEDPRFRLLVEALAGVPGQFAPTVAVLAGSDEQLRGRVRAAATRLLDTGLAEPVDAPPPAEPGLRPNPLLWSAARGAVSSELSRRSLRITSPDGLPDPGGLVLDGAVRDRLAQLTALPVPDRATLTVVVRGPAASGRRTLLAALARAWGQALLEPAEGLPDDPLLPGLGPLAALLDALPVIRRAPSPAEPAVLPRLAVRGPLGVVLPAGASLAEDDERASAVLDIGLPDRAMRHAHWRRALPDAAPGVARALADHRLGAATIHRVARQARTATQLTGHREVTTADVAEAARLHRSGQLDALAIRIPAARGWHDLAVPAPLAEELRLLEQRCRWREELAGALPAGPGAVGTGVRALFTGASGTGKTLAARCLAGALGKDLYVLDVARVVDQYLGVTEKNLDRVLRAAETLDVVLLVDEGDALLGRRTDVRSSNDRYANLETDYLLQRLQAHDGIVVVTTNAESRIDEAFTRRLDAIVSFPEPAAVERYAIWRAHLPDDGLLATDGVDPPALTGLAVRCALTGGQIRNAVLHACLLALQAGSSRLATADLETAVRREYAKAGAICPLPDPAEDGSGG